MILPRWIFWLSGLSVFTMMSSVAVAQQDDLCFMQTTSGQRISLGKLCGKSTDKVMSDFMWDENNYDPKFVTHQSDGAWSVVIGAPHPFKYPDGSILWPDGRVTEPEGYTSKLITKNGKVVGVQYYQADGKTLLNPGEVVKLPTGQNITQQDFR
jgi:hypothetical protein